jgi:hypothetical protein
MQSQLIFKKDAKAIQRRKDSLQQMVLEQMNIRMSKLNWGPLFTNISKNSGS